MVIAMVMAVVIAMVIAAVETPVLMWRESLRLAAGHFIVFSSPP
jgi:hypothetical protein